MKYRIIEYTFPSLIVVVLVFCVGLIAWGQEKKPEPKPTSSTQQYVTFQSKGESEYQEIGRIAWKDGTWQFNGDAAASAKVFVDHINRLEDEPCGRKALLDALALADRVFISPPPGITIHGSAGNLLQVANMPISSSSWASVPTPSFTDGVTFAPRTAAEKRAEAERLKREAEITEKFERQQAAEQHERDEAATKIGDILKACR